MTNSQSTTTAEGSLGRDVLYAARYYLGKRWTLIAVAGVAIALGLSFGGWGWLVAAGLAPILLATLPCLIMCGFGYCMMCRSGEKQSTASSDVTGSVTSSAALGVAKMDQPAIGGASCCHGGDAEAQPPQMKQVQPLDEKRNAAISLAAFGIAEMDDVETQSPQVKQVQPLD